MLSYTIKIKDMPNCHGTWHMGRPKPPQGECISVSAYDDELNYIENNFDNIPLSKSKRVQLWTGDFANFIYNNL